MRLPFKNVDCSCRFSSIVVFELQKSFLKTGSMHQLFEVRIIKSLLGSEGNFSLHLLQRTINCD